MKNINIKLLVISIATTIILIVLFFISRNSENLEITTLPTLNIEDPIDTVTSIILPNQVPSDLQIIWESYSIINQDFIDKDNIDPKEMSEFAVESDGNLWLSTY